MNEKATHSNLWTAAGSLLFATCLKYSQLTQKNNDTIVPLQEVLAKTYDVEIYI